MMTQTHTMLPRLRRFGAAALVAALAGCTDFLTVPNPTVIDAGLINPVTDASTLAGSAQQNFTTYFGFHAIYGGWYTNEIAVAETFPTRNEFGLRNVANTNGSLNTDLWVPLSGAMASSRIVLGLALPTPTTNINRAQAALFAGYSFEMMAESFCQGTVAAGAQTPGPKLTVANMIDSAIANFTIAITVGTANGTTAGLNYARAATVGRARANLQKLNYAGAAADAALVPAGYVFNLVFVDDFANRTRLGNTVWQLTRDRGSVSVDSAWRQAVDTSWHVNAQNADPRVPWANGNTFTPNLTAQDGTAGPFYVANKFNGYGLPIRLASKLEADYIAAEASQNIATIAAFILARRQATFNNTATYTTPGTLAAAIRDLMTERGYDFFLEGKRIGDLQRNGAAAIRGLGQPGSVYFKPGFPAVGTQSCYPVPFAETSTNPNFP
jgi:hypothetical protein